MVVGVSRCFQAQRLPSRSQLFARAANGDSNALEQYVSINGNVDARDEDGLALIHYAACHGNIQLIHDLRRHGADLNLLDTGSPPWKPVHYAIFHRRHEAEEVLKELGVAVPIPMLKRVMLERSPPDFTHGRVSIASAITK